jgi:hypothetical protein
MCYRTHTKQPFRRQVERSPATEVSSSREQQPWRGRRARHWLACNRAGIYFGFRSIRPCPWLGQQDSERQLSWDWTPDSLTRSTSKFVNVQHELDGETSINLHPGPWARWPHEKASPQRCAAITVTVTRRSGSLLLSLSTCNSAWATVRWYFQRTPPRCRNDVLSMIPDVFDVLK